jgi:hypothetical protein
MKKKLELAGKRVRFRVFPDSVHPVVDRTEQGACKDVPLSIITVEIQ